MKRNSLIGLIDILKEASEALEGSDTCRGPLSDELYGCSVMMKEELEKFDAEQAILKGVESDLIEISEDTHDRTKRSIIQGITKEISGLLAGTSHESQNSEADALAGRFFDFGRKIQDAGQLPDEQWSDEFDRVIYEADSFLLNLMNDHNLTRQVNDED